MKARSVNIRCTGVTWSSGHNRNGVLRNEVWEAFWRSAEGCTAACRSQLAELRREVVELRRQARYYRRMHGKAVEREQRLKGELQAARAKLKELRLRLRERWARRRGSEKRTSGAPALRPPQRRRRRRGQQPGAAGHGRRQHGHLPVQVETHDVDPQRRRCPACGDEYGGTAVRTASSWRSRCAPTGG